MAVVVLLLSAVLGTGFLATRLSQVLRIPHSVLLVLLGIVAGWLARSAGFTPSPEAWHHFPEIVLYVLLPPLVFDSAYHMDVEELRRDRWPLLFLSVLALLASCLLVGAGLKHGLGFDWRSALIFGALISATDPVAVVALFRELGARQRLTLLIEGESPFNDGTAIVLFRVLLMGVGQGNLILNGGLNFLAVSLGGVLVGLVFSLLFRFLFRFTADSSGQAQIGLTLTAAYVSFVIADHWLGASGVLATLTVGLYLGARARLTLNREALKSMHTIWDFFALCANTVILSGIVEVTRSLRNSSPRLFAGSFLGELSLLFEVPRTATATALVDTDVVEIERPLFQHLQGLSEPFQQRVYEIAQERASQAGITSSDP